MALRDLNAEMYTQEAPQRPAKRHQTAAARGTAVALPPPAAAATPAAVTIYVPQGGFEFREKALTIWRTSVPQLGGALTQDATLAAITHALVPPLAAGGWAHLPPELRPGSGASPPALAYVGMEWLYCSLKQRRWQPAADYPPDAPLPADWDQHEAAAGPAAGEAQQQQPLPAAQDAARLQFVRQALRGLPEHSFDLLTYNIWRDPVCLGERMRAVGRIICSRGCPDFLLLQEVTHASLSLLAAQPWAAGYRWTDAPPGACADGCCFTAVLARRDTVRSVSFLEPKRFSNQHMEVSMQRDVKSLRGVVQGVQVRVAALHLMHGEGGRVQLRELRSGVLAPADDANFVLAGDTNWTHPYPPLLPEGWVDVWSDVLRPWQPGYTWHGWQSGGSKSDTSGDRIDRVFACLRDWQPAHIELLGAEPIPGLTRTIRTGQTEASERQVEVWPSDHLGVYVRFRRAS